MIVEIEFGPRQRLGGIALFQEFLRSAQRRFLQPEHASGDQRCRADRQRRIHEYPAFAPRRLGSYVNGRLVRWRFAVPTSAVAFHLTNLGLTNLGLIEFRLHRSLSPV